MKPNELIDNMVEKSKAEVKPTIPQKPAAPKPKMPAVAPKPSWKQTKTDAGTLYEKDGKKFMYNDDDIPELDRSTYRKHFEDAINIDDPVKLKKVHDNFAADRGKDSYEARAYRDVILRDSDKPAKPNNEPSDDDIYEALADYDWQVTPNTTAGQYANEIAGKLKTNPEKVMKVLTGMHKGITPESNLSQLMDRDGAYDLDNERSYGPVRYKNVNEAYADFEKYLGSGEPDEIDRFNNAAEQLDIFMQPYFKTKEEKAKWDNISQTGTGEQIIDMAKSIIERSQKPKVSAEPVYNENDGWESWADKMDQFVPKDWETDGWDGNTRIYTAPNGDSVWVHAGGGVTVYPANFNGPNDIKSYDSVTEYINGSKKVKTNVPQEQPKTDWHEKGFMLGRQNGLSDEESDELATLIYNFMKNKNK